MVHVTPPTGPRVAVVLLNWNGWGDTIACLESLMRLTHRPVEVILVDNGSTDGSVAHIRAWAAGRLDVLADSAALAHLVTPACPKPVEIAAPADPAAPAAPVTLIEIGQNLGFAGGNNVGLRVALERKVDYVWVLNTDCVVAPDSLSRLLDRMAQDATIGMCGACLCHYHAPEVLQEAGGCAYFPALGLARRLAADRPLSDPPDWAAMERRLGYVSAAACLVSAEFLTEVGEMSEAYFLYGEEIDWALRARGRFKLAIAPQARVWHRKGAATGSKSLSTARSVSSSYYLWRARRRVTARFHPWSLPILMALGVAAAGANALRGRRKAAVAIWRGVRDRPWG